MAHVIMGTILLSIAILLIFGGIITSPKLERMGIRHSARYSFAAVTTLMGAYVGWVSVLFYGDKLGSENYVVELWGLRVLLLLACIHFVWSVWRCDP